MSGHCPVCNNKIEITFGMLQCSQCQSVLFVDFAGNIIIGGSEVDEILPNKDGVPPTFSHDSNALNINSVEGEEFTPSFPESSENNKEGYLEEDTNVEDIELTTNEYSEVRVGFFTEEESFVQNNHLQDLPVDNENHSQADLPLIPLGTMNYKIKIRGIDSSNLRQAVLNSLKDKRLGLVSGEIMNTIDMGQLTITGLNPVKASVIMNSLKELALDIDWELYGKEET